MALPMLRNGFSLLANTAQQEVKKVRARAALDDKTGELTLRAPRTDVRG